MAPQELFEKYNFNVLSNHFVYEEAELNDGKIRYQSVDYNREIIHSMNKAGYIY